MWTKPSAGFMKVNVSAVFSKQQRAAGIGCVIRDAEGRFRCASSGLIGLAPPVASDLWALFYGLKLAWEMNIRQEERKFVVETDSLDALEAILEPNPTFAFAPLVGLISSLLKEKWNMLEVTLVDKNGNKVANTLAVQGLGGNGGIEVFDSAPTSVDAMITSEA